MTAPPLRYLPWMVWDLARGAGIAMAVVGVLTAFLISTMTVVTSGTGGEAAVFLGILDFAVTVFALLATAGIVSTDFGLGYYRTLFARPVSPLLYYLQRWLLGGVVVLVATSVVGLAAAARIGTQLPIGRVLAQAALYYLLLGGLVFLLSTVTRRDWLFAVLVVAAHAGLGLGQSLGAGASGTAALLYTVLPPFGFVDVSKPVPAGGDLLHVLLYGLALVGAALAVIRFRPLARGARE
jgi:ABC-type transport system involved in multi-copper enzyme maturation permease subunit